jgi:hypothetical protein
LNSLPQTGISREPWGPTSPDQRPSITSHINSCGNLPPLRCAMRHGFNSEISRRIF